VCLSRLSWILWVLGYADQAQASSHTALLRAHQLAHPLTLAGALGYAALLQQSRRDGQAATACADALLALSADQGFGYWGAYGMIFRGGALALEGPSDEGIAQMHQGLARMHAMGAAVGQSFFLAQLAEAYRCSGQADQGLRVVAEALAVVDRTGERGYEAALHRLRGELLLTRSGSAPGEAECCFHRALDVARRQQAKSLELPAAVCLARLWQQQGKRAEAYDVLAPISGWFTEGFDTADLQEAQALLEALRGEPLRHHSRPNS
jgi:predicted ATPase